MRQPLIILLIHACILCCGCVGLIMDGKTKHIEERPHIHGSSHQWPSSVPSTMQEVLSELGEPTRKSIVGDEEIWLYQSKDRYFCGTLVFIVVPVPLMLPVCHTDTIVHFQSGIAVKLVKEEVATHGGYCMLLPLPTLDSKGSWPCTTSTAAGE